MAVNWVALKSEYIATRLSLRRLAEKHGVPYSTVQHRAAAEGWAASRALAEPRIYGKTVRRVIEKTAEKEAGRMARLLTIGDRLAERVAQSADAEEIDSGDLQRLTVALKNLYSLMPPPKDETNKDAGGLTVHFEGSLKEASE